MRREKNKVQNASRVAGFPLVITTIRSLDRTYLDQKGLDTDDQGDSTVKHDQRLTRRQNFSLFPHEFVLNLALTTHAFANNLIPCRMDVCDTRRGEVVICEGPRDTAQQ